MTRQIYLHRLKEALEGLPREEQESAMRYCEEYFDEAGEDQFEQAVHDLGSPEEFERGSAAVITAGLTPISRNLRNGRGR